MSSQQSTNNEKGEKNVKFIPGHFSKCIPKKKGPAVEGTDSVKLISLRAQAEQMLHNAVIMTEMAMDFKEKTTAAEKNVKYLRSLIVKSNRAIIAMQSSAKSFLFLAQKLTTNALNTIEALPVTDNSISSIKHEYEKLLNILDKEISDIEDAENIETCSANNDSSVLDLSTLSDKIKSIESKQKLSDSVYLPSTSSTKSMKSDIDEKYPENVSRESLLDYSNMVNLPTVPEDMFVGYPKPAKTSSMSSLKNMRKVKLYLQRAVNHSEDEDESENEEHDYPKGESNLYFNELRNALKAGILGNITEETPQD